MGVPHRSFWIANMVQVRGRRDLAEYLARRSDVARVEPNRPRCRFASRSRRQLSPDSGMSIQSIQAVAASPEWNVTKIGAPSVWAAGFTGQGIVVAGADTGYDWTHPALKGKYRGWNGTTADHNYNWHDAIHNAGAANTCGSNTTAPCDDDTHGTHTMGIMVGDGGANKQVGIAPGARWIGCRNMDRGTGTPARYTECFQFFLAPTNLAGASPDPSKAPDVVNNSWDCPPSEGCTDPAVLKSIIESLKAAGIAVVVAGGNQGSGCNTMDVPEKYAASISVGATDSADAIASYSSRGPGDNNMIKPEFVAPGSGIRSTLPGGGYGSMSGTSMASPHAAGAIAVLLSAFPALIGDVDGVVGALESSALPRTTTQTCGGVAAGVVPNNTAGWGRIDVLAAYNNLASPNVEPTVTLTSPANGASFVTSATIPLAATASDTDGAVTKVDFFEGPTKIATVTSPPYTYNWPGVGAGTYVLTAVATDNRGGSTTSNAATVTVGSGGSLPSPWLERDVGAVGVAGSASFASGAFSVRGSGADVYGLTDQFHFVYQELTGDGEIVARVASVANTNNYAKAGVMIRQDLTTNSPYAMVEILPRKASGFQWRLAPGGTTASSGGNGAAPYWVRLVRSGNTFTGYQSADGTSWQALGSTTVALAADVFVGLAVTAHNNTTTCTAVFDNVAAAFGAPNTPPTASITSPVDGADLLNPDTVSITADASDPDGVAQVAFYDGASLLGTLTAPPWIFPWSSPPEGPHALTVQATDNRGLAAASATVNVTVEYTPTTSLPPPWQERDIGSVGVPGGATFSSGAYTVQASGSDIYNKVDQFHFVYQALSGNGEISARVVSVQNTSDYAKAGLMIRQDLTTDSPYAMMEVLPKKSSAFQWRPTAGAFTSSVGTSGAAPIWLRLVRSGNTFSGYRSSDGVTWTLVSSQTVSLATDIYVGLAVTAHNNTATCTAVFDQVAVTP